MNPDIQGVWARGGFNKFAIIFTTLMLSGVCMSLRPEFEVNK
jgi:hypothetical protein